MVLPVLTVMLVFCRDDSTSLHSWGRSAYTGKGPESNPEMSAGS